MSENFLVNILWDGAEGIKRGCDGHERRRLKFSPVRLDAVFYGPGGGAHCLLKWCFNSPAEAGALTHTHTEAVVEGGNIGGEGVGAGKRNNTGRKGG